MRRDGIRKALTIVATISLPFVLACEDDDLVPQRDRPDFDDCNDPVCQSGRLDAGHVILLDSGVVTSDSGIPSGELDSGVVADSGASPGIDAGVLDSGANDSGTNPGSPDAGTIDFLNLAGVHDTTYKLDLSRYLFGLGNIAGPLDTIDQALSGQIDTGISFIDDLIADIISTYIPPWVGIVVHVLNTLANLFEEVDVVGVMQITQTPIGPTALLSATESWDSITIYVIDGCPLGRNDPTYPGCAKRVISTAAPQAVGPLTVGVEVHPFEGILLPGLSQADFTFRDREVEMEVNKLVTLVANIAIYVATNGQVSGVEDALNRAIDCMAFAAAGRSIVESFLGSSVGAASEPLLQNACAGVKFQAKNQIINALNNISIDWEVLDFDQFGRAVDLNGNRRADRLQSMSVDDTIDGRFRALGSARLKGEWEGINTNP